MHFARARIRRWQSYAGIFHLATLSLLVLLALWWSPQIKTKKDLQITEESHSQTLIRQQLIEALDKFSRFERYYRELHGRYTRDLSRLNLPMKLASGSIDEISRHFEISVLETSPSHFMLLATGLKTSDRVSIDERHNISANFILPAPPKAYLLEEAERILRRRLQGLRAEMGIVNQYWRVQPGTDQNWFAVGMKSPVLGEKRELGASVDRAISSVRPALATDLESLAMREEDGPNARGGFKEKLDLEDVHEWLDAARFAQFIYQKEYGRFAQRWDDLDLVSGFRFSDRIRAAKNLRVYPIDLVPHEHDYRILLEGTDGDVMGEQFYTDQSGAVRQVRYTEALIQQLQTSTSYLESTQHFQIHPVSESGKHKIRP